MKHQRGYMQLLIVLGIAAAGTAVGAGAWLTFTSAIDRANAAEAKLAEKNQELADTRANLVVEQREREADQLMFEARIERTVAAHERNVETEQRAQRAIARRNEDQIRETSMRDGEKYARVAKKVMKRNNDAFACRSNLKTVRDENACPITVR